MKVFISSVIAGFEPWREAAARAIRTLGYSALRAEEFGASPRSAQRVCLEGVRSADAVVLLLGERYGEPQASGFSPTHEEFLEARERRPILAFVQQGVSAEARQQDFIKQVQQWSSGLYTSSFNTPEELHEAVIRQLHKLAVDQQQGVVDEKDLQKRARNLVPKDGHRSYETTLAVVVTAGPRQQVLRPAEIENAAFIRDLQREATFGSHPVLDSTLGTAHSIEGDRLRFTQDTASLDLDQLGSIRIVQPATRRSSEQSYFPALIEEDIQERIESSLLFARWVMDRVDPKGRLTHVAPLAGLIGASSWGWRTREEQRRNPNVGQMSMRGDEPIVVSLSPVSRARPALSQSASELAQDLVVLLRRAAK